MERSTRREFVPRSLDGVTLSPDQEGSLEAIRVEAIRTLARIAAESGADSPLHRLCSEVWRRRQEDATGSLDHGDHANAVVILKRALDLVALAPTILARDEMTFRDLESLLWAA